MIRPTIATVNLDAIAANLQSIQALLAAEASHAPGVPLEPGAARQRPGIIAVLKANAARVEPRCPHFGICGGCSQQHFDVAAQVAAKQRTLEDALWRLGRVHPALLLPPCPVQVTRRPPASRQRSRCPKLPLETTE